MSDRGDPQTPLFRLEALLAANQPFAGERTQLVPIRLQTVVVTVAGLLLACVVVVARIETTRRTVVDGELVPVDGEVSVRIPRAGVVDALFVTEGQRVRTGDRLIRVAAAADWLDGQRISDSVEDSMAARRAQLALRRSELQKARDLVQRDIETRARHLAAQGDLAKRLVEVQERRLRFAEQRFRKVGASEERGFLSAYAFGELRDGVLAREQAVAEGRLAWRRIIEQLDAAGQAGRHRLEELETEVATINLRLSDLDVQRLREGARWSYEITAPRDGTVAGLEEVSGGAVVPGQRLLTLLSDGSDLKARLYARADSAAGLVDGMSVELRIGAYPFQKFGTVAGVVERVSTTTVVAERSHIARAAGVPVYVLDVALDAQSVGDGGVGHLLRPGMDVTAELVLDRRRLGRRVIDALTALR